MLMTFGFYNDHSQLSDLVKPLMHALDHTNKLQLEAGDQERFDRDAREREHRRTEREAKAAAEAAANSDVKQLDAVDNRRKSSGAILSAMLGLNFFSSAVDPVQEEEEEGLLDDTLDGHPVYKTGRQMEKSRRDADNISEHTAGYEGAFLALTESFAGTCFIMSVVVIAVTVSLMQITNPDDPNDAVYDSIGLVCTIIFMIDIVLRGYCASIVREGGIIPYFGEPLNLIDLALVILDVVLLTRGSEEGSSDGASAGANAGRLGRILRVARFLRMARLLRVLRLYRIIVNSTANVFEYQLPQRFLQCTVHKAKTMTTIIKTLILVYNRIQDNSLEILINVFQDIVETEKNGKEANVKQLIKVALTNDDALGLIPRGFDQVLVDVIMYDNFDLTNMALKLLMLHKNKRHILLSLSKDIQIIYSPKVEGKLAEAKKNLLTMRGYAEMYEIWQGLSSPEDLETADALEKLIDDMTRLMRKVNEERTLAVKKEFIPDEEVQNLLRNLDAMTSFMTVLDALYDGGREEPPERIKHIMRKVSHMVYMYVLDNPRNQFIANEHLQFFIDRVDDELDSAQVVQGILHGNSELIKACHKKCVDLFAQKVFMNGRRSYYMKLFEGLAQSVSYDMDLGMKGVHHNISRYLTSREWQPRILLWCQGPESPEYEERVQHMAPLLEKEKSGSAVSEADMSEQLNYHVSLIRVLSSCSLGPKLQAIYQFDDIVAAIIDKKTAFVVKVALVKALDQLICNGAAHFMQSEYIWRFFDDFVTFLDDLCGRMERIWRRPYSSDVVLLKTQLGEYLESCLSITTIYFAVLDLQVFGVVLYQNDKLKLTQRLEADVQITIKRLYNGIRVFVDRFPLYLGNAVQDGCSYALVSLSKHSESLNYNYNGPDLNRASKKTQRSSVTLADVQQLQLRHKFGAFTEILQDSDLTSNEDSINFFLSIPQVNTGGEHEVRPVCTDLLWEHLAAACQARVEVLEPMQAS
jgi:hypothetical protein